MRVGEGTGWREGGRSLNANKFNNLNYSKDKNYQN